MQVRLRAICGGAFGLTLLIGVARGGGGASSASASKSSRSGKAIFQECLVCHGTREMQRGPILNGLPAWYVELELTKFRAGIRGRNSKNRAALLMATGAALLRNQQEVKRVAQYIGSLPPKPYLKTIRGDVTQGQTVFAICRTCHGNRGEGNPAIKAPPLNVQEDWYLYDQLWKFRHGYRGTDPRDTGGEIMRAITGAWNDTALRNVVAYVAQSLAVVPHPARKHPRPFHFTSKTHQH